MNLKIYELSTALLDKPVRKVIAEDYQGFFGLLPRHIDFVTALSPGIIAYESVEGVMRYAAIDEGVLVKAGQDVIVTTTRAVLGNELGELKETFRQMIEAEEEHNKKLVTAAARLEADLARKFMRFGRQPHV